MDHLIDTLEKSLEKHGEKPLTNKWLLNLLKTAKKKSDSEEILLVAYCSIDDIY